MNRLIKFISITVLLIFNACNKTPQIIYSEKNNTQAQSTQSKINITIENCDSVIVMLAALLDPIESYPILENKLIRERPVRVRTPGVDFSGDKGYESFIWDLNCLIGMSSSEVIELFCLAEAQNDYLEIDKMFQEREEPWLLSVNGAGRGFSIRIYKGKVIRVSRDEVVNSDK